MTGSESSTDGNGAIDKTIEEEIKQALPDVQTEIEKGLFVECFLKLLCDEERFNNVYDASDNNTDGIKFEKMTDLLDLQDGIILFCCNWDVIHVFYDYVKPDEQETPTVQSIIQSVLSNLDKKMDEKNASITDLRIKDQLAKIIHINEEDGTKGEARIQELLARCDAIENQIKESFTCEKNKGKLAFAA